MGRLIKKSQNEILSDLQKDLNGELETIKLYETHIQIIDIPEIKNKLIEIKNEEEVHAKELQELIDKYFANDK